jgi:hypothetical protein
LSFCPRRRKRILASLNQLVHRVLPTRWHSFVAGIRWIGWQHQCPVCRWPTRVFRPLAVVPPVPERCSRCGSLARHRLLWLFLHERTDLFRARLKVLHFAPEACFQDRLRKLPNLDYTTADLAGGYVKPMEVLDVTAIDKPNDAYDLVLCLHVLQAVEHDALAMREIWRILKPGGWAILNSRINPNVEHTYPNPALPAAEVRAAATNQDFAFRIYGRDFPRRLEAAGFEVTTVDYRNSLRPDLVKRYGLQTPSEVFVCRKPGSRASTGDAPSSA